MHTCLNCGHEFDGKFCPECGAKWIDPDTCPKCGVSHEPNATFCQECGARLDGKITCPKCGALMDAKASFCGECGEKLGGEQQKKAKVSTHDKVMKALALSGIICFLMSALMGLVFTFVSGVSLMISGSGKAVDTHMLYYYFGDAYKEIKSTRAELMLMFDWSKIGDVREFALYFPAVLGTVISAVGILGTVVLSALTAFKTYQKYYKKEDVNVVAPAVATYLTFVTLATLLVALEALEGGGLKAAFSKPTLAGLITGGVFLGLGVLLLSASNYRKFNGFNAMVGTICAVTVSAFTVVVIALASLPAGGFDVSYITSEGKVFYGLFSGMQFMLGMVEKDETITKIVAFATVGGVAGIALAIVSAVTLFRKIPSVCNGKNNSNLILGTALVVLSVLYLTFSILFNNAAVDFYLELSGLTGEYEEVARTMLSCDNAVSITLLVMAALAFAAEVCGKVIRKNENEVI